MTAHIISFVNDPPFCSQMHGTFQRFKAFQNLALMTCQHFLVNQLKMHSCPCSIYLCSFFCMQEEIAKGVQVIMKSSVNSIGRKMQTGSLFIFHRRNPLKSLFIYLPSQCNPANCDEPRRTILWNRYDAPNPRKGRQNQRLSGFSSLHRLYCANSHTFSNSL